VAISGPIDAQQGPREQGMGTANTFMSESSNLFSGGINFQKSKLFPEKWNAMKPAQIAHWSARGRIASPTGPTLCSASSLVTFSMLLTMTSWVCLL